ncbi:MULTISPECIES: folylpolyglutamate synthase/dihydrofolate synthase family protein [Sorangium]|uniref:Dihydrofolate synthase/folylpolyglutamate synthase n=1 Tax=Sorangium cellulosum TaxID=56 RepID=A0A4P2QXZ0_SORCE|nr:MULTISPECIES: folylpolyglutamate synthase/dihydrofolate synthase family protein [Sorangium]AUX35128.1 folylpolyglutamate synthase [Sorangium cellulosum]WCQ94433.1 Folylpolyglutamate synthase [Sorangium sp. Soce836]
MSSAAPRLPALLEALGQRAPRGMVLGLDRVREALAALGDPHADVAAVHVAGTNGKGSVCAMVESVARAAGLRTGLYTSPHLSRFAERIRIDGEPIGDAALERALSAALERVPSPLTFFEALTVAAFVAFRDAGVDLAILEVGLGGRLDATNVLAAPLCTAITSIAFDHVALLGPTLADIAREKAGILKPGAPVVLGPLDPEADAAIEAAARAISAGPRLRVARAERGGSAGEIAVGRAGPLARATRVAGPGRPALEVELGLRGAHQAENAGVACGIAWQLASRWPEVERALPAGLAAARWPGRLERIDAGAAEVLLDCAHNPHGAQALAAWLDEEGPGAARTALVFGAMADKGWGEMLQTLAPRAQRRLYATPQGRAAAPLEALRAIAPGEPIGDPRAAVARAIEVAGPGGLVVVTGSIYLVGEVRSALLGIAPDPVVTL